MSEQKSTSSGSIVFIGALTSIAILLKLFGAIHLNWLWVLSPAWIPPAFVLTGVLLYLIAMAPAYFKKQIAEARVRKIMEVTGKNIYAARVEYYLIPKGKWREWIEEERVKVKN